ncbi:Lrp/AsnC family transcriptional regulator [Candidatus Woesearchaeota archaeon]|nr:Lrp/AsnC family transcriptional regulator [Candidatus Woesearchaeota archaeon]
MQLRKDGRQTLSDISRKISMPVSTIFDRLRANREDIITRFTCLLDFRKVGFACRTQIVFRIRKEDREPMQEALVKHTNVNSVYKINNGYDFLVEAVFRELREVDEFVEKLEERFKIHEKKVYYIIDDIAREKFLTDPVHAELLGVG